MGLLLRAWRERRGYSLRELGERSGVSYVTIAKIEAGTMSPTVMTLDKLAAALDVRVRDPLPVNTAPPAAQGDQPMSEATTTTTTPVETLPEGVFYRARDCGSPTTRQALTGR